LFLHNFVSDFIVYFYSKLTYNLIIEFNRNFLR